MSRRIAHVIPALALLVASSSLLFAAPKPRVPARPKTAGRVLLGTKQLTGDQAAPGQEYTLGKSSPLNFQLDSVEYSADRLRIGDNDYLPAADEKHLVIHFTLHNPQPRERLVRFDTLRYTAVDNLNTNHEARQHTGEKATLGELNMRLKPGQKVAAYTFIAVPAAVSVPKLIVTSSDNLVLRYDLNGKIRPLSGPAVSPDDTSGATALGEVPARYGVSYEMGAFDVVAVGAAHSAAPIGNQRLRDEARNLIVSLRVKNASKRPQVLRSDTLRVKMVDADGATVAWRSNLLTNSRDVDFNSRLDPGQEVSVRTYATVAKDQTVKTVSLTVGAGNRQFVYDLTAAQ
ncbi:MAG TPA: hypothetical protein VGM37_06300 [Armatimonadota bacterium]|jgi:hypothetical protein